MLFKPLKMSRLWTNTFRWTKTSNTTTTTAATTTTSIRSLTNSISMLSIKDDGKSNILSTCGTLPSTISYQLPQASQSFSGIVGDRTEQMYQTPILDFRKNNFAMVSSSVNSISGGISPLTPSLPPPPSVVNYLELDWSIRNIMNGIMYEYNGNKCYELPTERNIERIGEKKVDYYKHRDPKRFTHLTWIRHRKMKKHQRLKWRKKNLARIKRIRLERNIAKEKHFRAELLAMIREAENFDPKRYVENILHTIDNVPKPETPQEKYERYQNLIRKNRANTNFVLPKFDD